MDVIITGIFALFGVLANKRYKASFIIGMILYGLDGLLFIYIQDFFSLAFHAYALYAIFKGLQAINELNAIEKNLIELSNDNAIVDSGLRSGTEI